MQEPLSVKLLVLVTGSVAAIKLRRILQDLATALRDDGINLEVRVAASSRALHFLRSAEPGPSDDNLDDDTFRWKWPDILSDEIEFPSKGWAREDPVHHIQLRNWCDLALVLPLSANTLGGVVSGRADSIVMATLRAWLFDDRGKIAKPLLAFPAMNTGMWMHPLTQQQLAIITEWGWQVINPISKTLACGDVGMGALPEVDDCVGVIRIWVSQWTLGL